MTDQQPLALSSPVQLVSHLPGTWAECSVASPTGDGVRDISFICRGPAPGDYTRWYDTYDGVRDAEPDWYALHLPRRADINTVFFMHGPIYAQGGWWLSLSVQYLDLSGEWRDISELRISPAYDFAPRRGSRQPFEPFAISFDSVQTSALRLFGRPGGEVCVTTLAYMAAGSLSAADLQRHLEHLRMPQPRIFRLLGPNRLWELMLSLREVTGIVFDVQSQEGLGLDHFLDEQNFLSFHERQDELYDPGSLYHRLGMDEGWDRFGAEMRVARANAIASQTAQIATHHGGMLWISIPVVFDGAVLGTIENRNLLGGDELDLEWHQAAAPRLGLEWPSYLAALRQVPAYEANYIQQVIRLVQVIVAVSQQQLRHGRQVQELRSAVEELASPVMPVWDRVLAVPLIGRIDDARARQVTTAVLQQINERNALTIILDVTGVQLLDADVARALSKLVQAAHLLGASAIISGIRPEVAETLVSTGSYLQGVRTYTNLQVALEAVVQERTRLKKFTNAGCPR